MSTQPAPALPFEADSSFDGPIITIGSSKEDVAELLRWLQSVLLRHPLATREAVGALVAEGRRFATTEEGRQWRERLERSELVRQGRTLYEGLLAPLFDDSVPAGFPVALVQDMLRAATSGAPRNGAGPGLSQSGTALSGSVVHRTHTDFGRANDLVFLLLGLVSVSRSLDALASRSCSVAEGDDNQSAPFPIPDRLMELLLGSISLGASVRHELRQRLPAATSSQSRDPIRIQDVPHGLLR